MSVTERDTEQKIKEAARQIFLKKGYAATKTRDIAEAADINVALLNYYFRSKKKLYDIIMVETLRTFFGGLVQILNKSDTTLKEKVFHFVGHYMDLLEANQNLASFILNAVRESPDEYITKIGLLEQLKDTVFIAQFKEGVVKGDIPMLNPIHFLLNLMALTVFPFLSQPIIVAASEIPNETYMEIIQERRRLIPRWIESMLTVT